MQTVDSAEFQQRCLAVVDTLGPEGIVITKDGRPIAKLIPLGPASKGSIGSLVGKLRIRGNLLSTRIAWKAEPRHFRPGQRLRK